jgi:membrane-associated phospholipid phosphatase
LTSAFAAGPAAADAVETSGDVLRWAIPAAAGYVAWRREDDEVLRQFAVAFAGTAASTLAIKELVDKERPNGDSKAFPSGHAATSFAGATFLHRRYGWREALPAYALSAYVGWTRLDADEHEIEDVLGGAALAAAWSWWLVDPRRPPAVVPLVSRGGVWLRITARW